MKPHDNLDVNVLETLWEQATKVERTLTRTENMKLSFIVKLSNERL